MVSRQASEHDLRYLPIGSNAVLLSLPFITPATCVELSELQWWNWMAWTVGPRLWPRFSHLALTFFSPNYYSVSDLVPFCSHQSWNRKPPVGSFFTLPWVSYMQALLPKEMCITGTHWHQLLLWAVLSLSGLYFSMCHFIQLLLLPSFLSDCFLLSYEA